MGSQRLCKVLSNVALEGWREELNSWGSGHSALTQPEYWFDLVYLTQIIKSNLNWFILHIYIVCFKINFPLWKGFLIKVRKLKLSEGSEVCLGCHGVDLTLLHRMTVWYSERSVLCFLSPFPESMAPTLANLTHRKTFWVISPIHCSTPC